MNWYALDYNYRYVYHRILNSIGGLYLKLKNKI